VKKAKDQPESEPAELASLVGERIRKIRKEEGLSLELFALPAKRNRAFPTGNALLYISLSSVVFGRVRPIQGRTLFLFHRGWVYIKPHHRNSL
jgi:hypothetical protein